MKLEVFMVVCVIDPPPMGPPSRASMCNGLDVRDRLKLPAAPEAGLKM